MASAPYSPVARSAYNASAHDRGVLPLSGDFL